MNLDLGTIKEVSRELSPSEYTVDKNGNVTILGNQQSQSLSFSLSNRYQETQRSQKMVERSVYQRRTVD